MTIHLAQELRRERESGLASYDAIDATPSAQRGLTAIGPLSNLAGRIDGLAIETAAKLTCQQLVLVSSGVLVRFANGPWKRCDTRIVFCLPAHTWICLTSIGLRPTPDNPAKTRSLSQKVTTSRLPQTVDARDPSTVGAQTWPRKPTNNGQKCEWQRRASSAPSLLHGFVRRPLPLTSDL